MLLQNLLSRIGSIDIRFRTAGCAAAAVALHLIRRHVPHTAPLYYSELLLIALLAAGAAVLLWSVPTIRFFTNAVAARAVDRRKAVVLAAGGAFFALFAAMHYGMYRSFTFEWFDLGLFNQAVWNTACGRLLELTDPTFADSSRWPNVSMLGGHAEWILLPIAPVLKLTGSIELLLFIKIAALTASIFIVYGIAKKSLPAGQALAATLLYATFTPLHFIALKDFNTDPLAIPFLFAAWLFYIQNKKTAFRLCLLAALLCKEYAAFAVAAFGCLLLIRFRDRRGGLLCIAAGAFYFCFCYFVLNPAFNPDPQRSMLGLHFGSIGGNDGFTGILTFAAAHPLQFLKLQLSNCGDLFYLLLPLLFLPLFEFSTLAAAAVVLPKDLLIGVDISNHRPSMIIPFLFIGLISLLAKLPRGLRNNLLVCCCAASATAAFSYGPTPLGHRFWRECDKYIPDGKDAAAERIIARMPPEAPVSATPSFTPRLGHREILYRFPQFGAQGLPRQQARLILIDTADQASSWMQYRTTGADSLMVKVYAAGYSLVAEESGIFLFSRHSD